MSSMSYFANGKWHVTQLYLHVRVKNRSCFIPKRTIMLYENVLDTFLTLHFLIKSSLAGHWLPYNLNAAGQLTWKQSLTDMRSRSSAPWEKPCLKGSTLFACLSASDSATCAQIRELCFYKWGVSGSTRRTCDFLTHSMARPRNSQCILPPLSGEGEMEAEQTPLSFLVASFQISLWGCACRVDSCFIVRPSRV